MPILSKKEILRDKSTKNKLCDLREVIAIFC